MVVSQQELENYTGLIRPSAQARFMLDRFPKIVFTFRADGSIALRQEEYDRYTLGGSGKAEKRRWKQDLSTLDRAG